MFFTLFGVGSGGGCLQGTGCTTCLCSFHPGQLKNRSFETCFFDIVTTQNDHPRYVKHVLGRISCFSPYLGNQVGGGGGGSRTGANLLMQLFNPDSSKIEVFETCFFDIVTTQNDHPRYVKHVLGRIYVFFTLFGNQVGGGGGLLGDWYTTCLCSFSPRTAQKSKFLKLVFVIL